MAGDECIVVVARDNYPMALNDPQQPWLTTDFKREFDAPARLAYQEEAPRLGRRCCLSRTAL
jgi:hypothetical protein